MANIGMLSLLYGVITPTSTEPQSLTESSSGASISSRGRKSTIGSNNRVSMNRSISTQPGLYSYMSDSKVALERILFGYHAKTKRSLAEEAESGDETSVFSWIREGVDPDEFDAYGYTPLLNAAALGRVNAVVELVRNGADVNKTGPFGFTPLHAAAQNGHREVVYILLGNGSDINAQNDDLDTPMHLALRAHRIEIVYMLLRHGGNSRIVGFNNKDCVQCARDIGLGDLAKTLKNFNPNMGTHPFSTPAFSMI